jgi:putative hydroxymethylpyrimidine transport system substrate-binding protein
VSARSGRQALSSLGLVLLTITLLAVGCGSGAKEEQRIRLALDWVPNPDHVGLYYALDRGLATKNGLEVELQTPSDPSAGLKLVASGEFDVAISYEPEVNFAREAGLPVIAVAAVVPRPLNSVIALADSPVGSLADLRGRAIGVAGLPFDDAVVETIRRHEGFAEGELRTINVGFNLVQSLLSRNVDAVVGAYRNVEGIQIEQETGSAPFVVPLDQVGVPTYDELVLVANSDRLESDSSYADRVRRLVATLVDGTQQAIADPQGAIAVMDRVSDYETSFLEVSVPATLALLTPDGRSIGCMDATAWETFGDWLVENGLLEGALDVSTVMTTAYLAEC